MSDMIGSAIYDGSVSVSRDECCAMSFSGSCEICETPNVGEAISYQLAQSQFECGNDGLSLEM